jgi:hypothetical protein
MTAEIPPEPEQPNTDGDDWFRRVYPDVDTSDLDNMETNLSPFVGDRPPNAPAPREPSVPIQPRRTTYGSAPPTTEKLITKPSIADRAWGYMRMHKLKTAGGAAILAATLAAGFGIGTAVESPSGGNKAAAPATPPLDERQKLAVTILLSKPDQLSTVLCPSQLEAEGAYLKAIGDPTQANFYFARAEDERGQAAATIVKICLANPTKVPDNDTTPIYVDTPNGQVPITKKQVVPDIIDYAS